MAVIKKKDKYRLIDYIRETKNISLKEAQKIYADMSLKDRKKAIAAYL